MNTDSRALGSFRIVILGIIAAWTLFLLGIHYLYTSENYVDGVRVESFNRSVYFFLAAVIVGGGAALWAKRRTQKLLDPPTAVPHSVYQHSIAILIAATAAGAWALFVIFVNLLVTDHTSVALRIVNTYVPIVLFTVVVVYFLLAAFVFKRSTTPMPHPVVTPGVPAPPESTRTNALAYAVPIIGAAVAAITAGIIYDATGTALTAWLWALVFAIVAAGIVAGTHFASSLSRSTGASGLNFAWVIAFVVVSMATGFGYGAASVDDLHLDATLGMDAYGYDGEAYLGANGNQLQPRSDVVITAGSDGETIGTFKVDSDGWFYEEVDVSSVVAGGTTEFTITGTASDGSEFSGSLSIELDDDGGILMDEDGTAYAEVSKSLPVSPGWFIKDLLPGLVILMTGLAVMYLTIPMRARRHPIRHNG